MTDLDFDLTGDDAQKQSLKDERRRWSGGGTYHVGTAVEYAVYLEFGTATMDPKPFFRPAIQEARANLTAFVEKNTETTLANVDGPEELVATIATAIERRVKEIITEKGLVDTGALRASVQAVPSRSELKTVADVAGRADVDIDPSEIEGAEA